jgi:hypothetical protein
MRFMIVSLFIVALAVVTQAQDKEGFITVSAGDVPALVLKVAGKVDVTTIKGTKTVIHTKDMLLHLWVIGNASNVTEVVSRAADVIKADVLNFKPSSTNDITIGRAPAKQLLGPGTEADDGDEGDAEVVIFTVGARVFVGCIHGEGKIDPNEHEAMMAALQTAKAP